MRLLFLIILAIILSSCAPKNEFYGAVDPGKIHPSVEYINSEIAAGRNTSVIILDSFGGSTAAWQGLLSRYEKIGMVILRGECESACLLFAVAIDNKGVPVYLDHVQTLMWHGQTNQYGANATDQQRNLDIEVWKIFGLPQWAADVEMSLPSGASRKMATEEIARTNFRYYE